MSKTQYILGIEASCDETAAAVVTHDGRILSNIIASQVDEHLSYGGVVPEVAARAHVRAIDSVVKAAMNDAELSFNDLTAVAATGGPGLIGGVLVGTSMAKAIAVSQNIPYFAINHLEGHALTARLTSLADGGIDFPYLLLLVSGGHTQLLAVVGVGDYRCYGTTLDDAAGEAFDKSAKLLGLPLPGGREIEILAEDGDDSSFTLPKPLAHKSGCDFSFSGLKTAVLTAYNNHIANEVDVEIMPKKKANLAASLQRVIAEILVLRSRNGMQRFLSDFNDCQDNFSFVLAGGVGANKRIRQELAQLAETMGFSFAVPPPALCTDNAVMIAWAAAERIQAGFDADLLTFSPRPRWPLDNEATLHRGLKA